MWRPYRYGNWKFYYGTNQFLKFIYKNNKVYKIVDVLGRTMEYSYNGSLLEKVTYPNNGTVEYKYNKDEYITSITDQNEHKYVENSYDFEGRVTSQKLVNGQEYKIHYNDADRINTFVSTSNNNKIEYHYNLQNLVVKIVYKDGSFEEIGFDKWENKNLFKDRNGNITKYIYNKFGNLLEKVFPNSLIEKYEYDSNNNLKSIKDNNDGYRYYEYDKNFNIKKINFAYSGKQFSVFENKYDYFGRKVKEISPTGEIIEYHYDEYNKTPISFKMPENSIFNNKLDDAGRLMIVSNEFTDYYYGYTPMNKLAYVEDGYKNKEYYIYDKLSNLKKVIKPKNVETGVGLEIYYNILVN